MGVVLSITDLQAVHFYIVERATVTSAVELGAPIPVILTVIEPEEN
jgi:hypothetical protein